jgi:DNA-binding transcriptional LysR family regulator
MIPTMQLEALKVFCDVARSQSVSLAAQANDLTQSAASHIVRQLEGHLGVQLVDRSTRPLRLTAFGQRFYEGCREIVGRWQELEASFRGGAADTEATVEVAAIYSVSLGDMGKYVDRFKLDHPRARVHIDYLHPDRVYERIVAGSADFGIVSFAKPCRKWEVIPWREEAMVLTCKPSHPLAALRSVRPEQLAGERFVAYDRALPIRRHIDRYLRRHGVIVDTTCELDNVDSIKKAVEELSGVALVPEPTLRREVQSGILVARPLSGEGLIRPLGIIYRRHQTLAPAASRFLDMLRKA